MVGVLVVVNVGVLVVVDVGVFTGVDKTAVFVGVVGFERQNLDTKPAV